MGNFIPSLLPGCSLTTPLSSGHRAEVGSCSTSISQPLDHVTPPWLCELREGFLLAFWSVFSVFSVFPPIRGVLHGLSIGLCNLLLVNCQPSGSKCEIHCGSSVSSGMWMILMDDEREPVYCRHLETSAHIFTFHRQGWDAKNSGKVPCFYSKIFIFARLKGICAESIQTENKCIELFPPWFQKCPSMLGMSVVSKLSSFAPKTLGMSMPTVLRSLRVKKAPCLQLSPQAWSMSMVKPKVKQFGWGEKWNIALALLEELPQHGDVSRSCKMGLWNRKE